jgi:hypothetical protein
MKTKCHTHLQDVRLKLKKTHQNERQNKPISHHIIHSRVEQEKRTKCLSVKVEDLHFRGTH